MIKADGSLAAERAKVARSSSLARAAASVAPRRTASSAIRQEVERKAPQVWNEQRLLATRDLLDQIPDAELVVGPEDEFAALDHCDAGDLHVLAAGFAAVREIEVDPVRRRGFEAVLVTDNIKDFEIEYAAQHGLTVVRRDAFGTKVLTSNPAAVLQIVQRLPDDRYQRFLAWMRHDEMHQTAAAIERVFNELDS